MCCSCIDYTTRVSSGDIAILANVCNKNYVKCRAFTDLVDGIFKYTHCCTCLDLIPPIITTTTTRKPPPSPPPPPSESSDGCFPASVKVKRKNGKVIQMSELQTGDRVQTGMGKFHEFDLN